MPMLSGNDGKVLVDGESVANVTVWTFLTKTLGVSYASSATGGYRKTLPGVRVGSGKVTFLQDTTSPHQAQFAEGDDVTLKLHFTDDDFFTVPAVITSISSIVEVDSENLIGGEFTFETNGAWTLPNFST
ncbi:MAG: hypothetical protein MI757_19545 [Pirellulales bacterium]|nr:hypothetical protein [Pirellulales bacterium]